MDGQTKKENHLTSNVAPVNKNSAKENSEAVPSTSAAGNTPNLSSNQVEEDQSKKIYNICKEMPVSSVAEPAKQQTFKLPTEYEDGAHNSENVVVGDDFTKKSEIRILCECEPNVTGGAVPAVVSFTPIDNQNLSVRCNGANCSLAENNNAMSSKYISETDLKIQDDGNGKNCTSTTNRNSKCFPLTNYCAKGICYPKRPSLIPKLTRLANNSNKSCNKDDLEKPENPLSQKHNFKSTHSGVRVKESTTPAKNNPEAIPMTPEKSLEQTGVLSNGSTISSRMLGLQERLKATTSMLRQKIEMDKSKENIAEGSNIEIETDEAINKDVPQNHNTVDELYRSIFSLREIASALSENNTLKRQTKFIEKLFVSISEIKLIADKLCSNDLPKTKQEILGDTNDISSKDKEKNTKSSTTNPKDNKIYIKFMHAKDKKTDGKMKKIKGVSADHSEEMKPEVALASECTSDSVNSDCSVDKNQEDNKIKESDSMDGVFIPSCEPPRNLEEDEETNGLDITITFPEFSHLYSDDTNSHLSVCLSDISAEALKKLKRCPKDFTLRMDFVEGKVLFQSGKGPTNNFQIGPDLKFAENVIDTRKSDVISIKPSTECSFGSQMIPVESPNEIKSYKSLKSTDSELFNVVSLPFLYKNPYLATSHKSCMTFRNHQLVSMAILAKHLYKSMPQIPSLTNIFEDKVMDNPSKTAFQVQEKRRKNRQDQRKWTSASSVL